MFVVDESCTAQELNEYNFNRGSNRKLKLIDNDGKRLCKKISEETLKHKLFGR